jgi:hypothetical protein
MGLCKYQEAITTALHVLVSPDFDKGFHIVFIFLRRDIVYYITQKNLKGEELPISFMRKTLHDYELKYSTIEKQAFYLVKEIAHFRTYILSSHVYFLCTTFSYEYVAQPTI